MRIAVALACLGILTAACGSTQSSQNASGDKLYAAVSTISSQFVAVIDSRSHQAERRLPLGVPSSDWKHLYSIVSTSLVDTEPESGSTLKTLQLGHAYRLPDATAGGMPGGLSPNGQWLVVERYDAPDNELPSATHLLLIKTPSLEVTGRIDLNGFFNFDAISNDGMRLYLIQYFNGKEYYVRLYDIAAGALDPNRVVDKSDGAAAMSGLKLSGVASIGGRWLFSLYVRDHANPFIHALSLDGNLAFCLDLPGKGYSEDTTAMQWSVAMSPDGARIYAANLATGTVAVVGMNESAPQILHTGRLALPTASRGLLKSVEAKELGGNAAVVSNDGRTLVVAGTSGVVWIDTQKLAIRQRALSGWRISSLGLSPDGQNLFAVSEGGKIAKVAMSSGSVQATFDLTGGQPMALMRVAAS